MAQALRNFYQIKFGLKGAKPPIWRRVLIEDTINLFQLHLVIQIAMGWENAHLFEFIDRGTHYGVPDPDFGGENIVDVDKVLIRKLLSQPKDKLDYIYDFGDYWQHTVELEKIIPFDTKTETPLCLDGRKSGPVEDIGGLESYYYFLSIYSDPTHPEFEDSLEVFGEDFDPNFFDKEFVNQLFTEVFHE